MKNKHLQVWRFIENRVSKQNTFVFSRIVRIHFARFVCLQHFLLKGCQPLEKPNRRRRDNILFLFPFLPILGLRLVALIDKHLTPVLQVNPPFVFSIALHFKPLIHRYYGKHKLFTTLLVLDRNIRLTANTIKF